MTICRPMLACTCRRLYAWAISVEYIKLSESFAGNDSLQTIFNGATIRTVGRSICREIMAIILVGRGITTSSIGSDGLFPDAGLMLRSVEPFPPRRRKEFSALVLQPSDAVDVCIHTAVAAYRFLHKILQRDGASCSQSASHAARLRPSRYVRSSSDHPRCREGSPDSHTTYVDLHKTDESILSVAIRRTTRGLLPRTQGAADEHIHVQDRQRIYGVIMRQSFRVKASTAGCGKGRLLLNDAFSKNAEDFQCGRDLALSFLQRQL